MKRVLYIFLISTFVLTFGCSHKVKMEAPDKPIRIDMNVKIDHEVRVQVAKDVREVLSQEKGLF